MDTDSDLDFLFKHPTAIQVSGPSGCGKTRLVLRILANKLIQPWPNRLIWVFSEWQPDYEEIRALYPHIEFIHGWQEDIYNRITPDERNLLVIDDLMDEAGSSKSMKALFTKGVHHRNCTVLYLLQNMFNQAKSQRTASLNTHYNVIFKNARDMSQFRTLASQMYPGQFYWLLDAFHDATSRPYGYLVLDHHPTTMDDDERALTNILPGERITYYGINKGSPPSPPPPPMSYTQWERLNANPNPKKTLKRSSPQSNFSPTDPTTTLCNSFLAKHPRV
jgi:hypothetical protein